jgi:ribonuclease HI
MWYLTKSSWPSPRCFLYSSWDFRFQFSLVEATVKAIELSASNYLLHHKHFIIESDSPNVISWMHNPHNRPWMHHKLFSSVNGLNAYFGSITYTHVFRESNYMADYMAKQGVRRSSEFVAWF